MTSVDQMDQEIVKYLKKDGRMTYAAIAKKVGLTSTAVGQRVQKMIDEGKSDAIIRDVGIRARSGQLVIVTGPVGGGKSAILLALAGELHIDGDVGITGEISFASEEPWKAFVHASPEFLVRLKVQVSHFKRI